MVARDGIEPPTPAFSGLRSTAELPGLNVRHASAENASQTPNSNKPLHHLFAAAASIPRYSSSPRVTKPGIFASSSHRRNATASR